MKSWRKKPAFNVYATVYAPYRQKFEHSNFIESGKKTLHREKALMPHLYYLWV